MERPEVVLEALNKMIPNPICELKYETPFQLLVAVILSAQCTDKRVNEVTKVLFKDYREPEDFASMNREELERIIHSCGFFRSKAKNIITMSKDLLLKFNGELPGTLEELTTLAGVGRKSANVIISEAFHGDAIAVDTHVFRVTNRLGIVKAKTPNECEMKLMQLFDKKDWSRLHYQFVLFGRYICKAVLPMCERCLLNEECETFIKSGSHMKIGCL